MAKRGTYNGTFFNAFAARLHGTPIRFGALVGTPLEDGKRDVVFAAPTPPQPDQEAAPKDIVAHLKSTAGPEFATWAVQHASAIQKLLPGGLESCGCFAVIGETAAKDLAPLLVPILKSMKEPIVLTVDPTSKKLSFWQHSGGAKPALRPAELKADAHKEALLLWATTLVDVVLPLPTRAASADSAEMLARSVLDRFAPLLDACTCGVAAGADAPMRVVDPKSEAAISACVPKDCSELRVTLLRGGTPLVVAVDGEGSNEGSRMRLRCLVTAPVIVLRRSTELRQSVALVRKSLAASAAARLQLAIEEVAEEGAEEGALPPTLPIPWRAYCKPQDVDIPMWCGDYCMPDESAEVARERLGQMLGLPEDMLEAAPGCLDERAQLERQHVGTYTNGPTEDGSRSASAGSALAKPAWVPAAIVAILAVIFPLLFFLLR